MRRTPSTWVAGNPTTYDGNAVFDDWRAVLDFETSHPNHTGWKSVRIRHMFNVAAARYYQRLNQIIRTEKAVAAYPALVRRIRDRVNSGPHHEGKNHE